MKNRIRFMFAWHKIVLNLKSFISSILVMTISLILIAFALSFIMGRNMLKINMTIFLQRNVSFGVVSFMSHPYRIMM